MDAEIKLLDRSMAQPTRERALTGSRRKNSKEGLYSLLTRRIQDESLSLIHIPLSLYPQFIQPTLRILFPPSLSDGASTEEEVEGLTTDRKHTFLNISVTPIECSIVCHYTWSKRFFEPIIKQLPKAAAQSVAISKESYAVMRVASTGMNAGSRLVDFTSPLALAGIPIFFIPTYYSDFIMIPSKDRQTVVQTLLIGGFECTENDSYFVLPDPLSHARGLSQNVDKPPSSPPPSDVAELESRVIKSLNWQKVVPHVEPDMCLIHCSGKEFLLEKDNYARPCRYDGNRNRGESWLDKIDTTFYTGLVAALVSQPRFLSVTLTEEDKPSLLLDKRLLGMFGDSLLGPINTELIPIFLNLVELPFEATGIVAVVAGKLIEEMQLEENAELSFLSTAKTVAVILSGEHASRALEILCRLLSKEA